MKHLSQYVSLLCFAGALILLLFSCKEDRTTIVFGKVVDQNQQPVDSVMILVTGTVSFNGLPILETFTGKDGTYVVNLDVPKKYRALNAFIPEFSIANPKYYKSYKLSKLFRNGQQTHSRCFAEIGEKTQWDFELEPK